MRVRRTIGRTLARERIPEPLANDGGIRPLSGNLIQVSGIYTHWESHDQPEIHVPRISLRILFIFLLVSFVPSLAAQQDAEKISEARRLLREASTLVLKIPEFQQPSAVANIAGEQARAGDLQGAFATAHLLPKAYDQAMAFGNIAWSLGHAGNLAGALHVVAASEDGASKAIAYLQLSQQRVELGDFNGGLRIAEMIVGQPGYKIPQLANIAEKQNAAGDTQGAMKTLDTALREVELAEEETKGSSHPTGTGWLRQRIAAAHAKAGNRSAALWVLEPLRTMAPAAVSPAEREELLRSLAQGYAKLGEFEAAAEVARQLPRGLARDLALQEIARERAAAQGDERAAIELASAIQEPEWARHAFRDIASRQAESGDLASAMNTLDHIQSDPDRAEAIASIALSLADRQQPLAGVFLQEAWEHARDAQGELPSRVWEDIAVSRGLLGDFSGAIQIVHDTKRAESRVWPLWNLTEFMVLAGKLQGAVGLAENERDPYPRLYSLLGTASGLLEEVEETQKKGLDVR